MKLYKISHKSSLDLKTIVTVLRPFNFNSTKTPSHFSFFNCVYIYKIWRACRKPLKVLPISTEILVKFISYTGKQMPYYKLCHDRDNPLSCGIIINEHSINILP